MKLNYTLLRSIIADCGYTSINHFIEAMGMSSMSFFTKACDTHFSIGDINYMRQLLDLTDTEVMKIFITSY